MIGKEQTSVTGKWVSGGRIEVVNTTDEATVHRKDGTPLHTFMRNQRIILLAIGHELTEEEIRETVPDLVVEAMQVPEC